MFSPLSIYADASIRGNFQHSPDQSLNSHPWENSERPYLLCHYFKSRTASFPAQTVKWTCYTSQWDRREGARKRKRHPSYTRSCCCVCMQRQGRSLQTGERLCQYECVLLLKMGNDRDKAYLWQLHSLSVVWVATSTTQKHPLPWPPRRSQKWILAKEELCSP